MAISYPLDLPTTTNSVKPAKIVLTAVSSIGMSQSPYTFKTQVQDFGGKMWRADVSYPLMQRADAEEVIAFLLKLNGTLGTFRLGDSNGATPRGTANGTPVLNGAAQTGQSIVTDGWDNSETVLKAGDYIQIGERLYKALDNVTSDGSGNATFDIWPDLRDAPADNTTIETADCTGLFRLSATSIPVLSTDMTQTYTVAFTAMEAL